MMRRKTHNVFVGDVGVGSDHKVTVQSMTNTDTKNKEATINQIKELEAVGCDIVRIAVPDMEAAIAVEQIKKAINIPLVADIHFDYRLAIECVKNGIDALRINPGNIGSKERVLEVIKACKYHNVPIRIGVNSGSVKKEYLQKYNGVNVDSLVESALEHVRILEENNFYDTVISVKSSDVRLCVESYRKIAKETQYPLHIGVTETGTVFNGTIKSSIGIGSLLLDGIGDTIRVSLTGDPVEEVMVGKQILRATGILNDEVDIISCPTCGRTQIDLISIATEVENRLKSLHKPLKVAVMGCVVNGPGEAKEADYGLAGGKGEGIIFKKGKIVKKVKEESLVDELIETINRDLL
ncbi:flavodoxin-dependent (E)-4-hydroxy-3-methylbut-2-enyl-diphosphate synthase [Abyssisolibacter fermentans]|uniref:flavodoxin-dependent (E)-4-hydroxy-3-methylbut-2-enyl-diphosphate synthase n=1 Tax=Abyssisolibacter fermentans TaxID=1766203 RepID=UPI000834A57B|nr:flavodoxin-dependent (E)-4-hydroxy-3-methylbut-2-enyl-diphosphate synthase [Abyssisolibacter fermentans]